MKKIFNLLCLMICCLFFATNSAFAASAIKNFYAYELTNVNIREFAAAAHDAVTSYTGKDNFVPLKDVENAYIYTGNDATYYVRIYPAYNNTNVFIVANEEYDVNHNDVTNFFDKYGHKYKKLTDKAAIKEYKYDFYTLARQQKLGNFYISPDMVKPLKVGMSAINNKLAKYSKKTSVIPYSVDNNPINLTCVDTTGYYDENSQIAIVKREYRLKEKENKYMHAYEYILTNNNTSTATITATSERLAGIKDVATETFIDLDRLDLIDTVGSFPPVLVCTAGLSILCSVPNWIRMAKVTKEAVRYTHSLPENYQLRSKGRMRILVLKYKQNVKPVKFNVKFSNQTYNIEF